MKPRIIFGIFISLFALSLVVGVLVALEKDHSREMIRFFNLHEALFDYEAKFGHLPDALPELLNATNVHRWSPEMLVEVSSGSSNATRAYDGRGGWVYNKDERMIGINTSWWEKRILQIPAQTNSTLNQSGDPSEHKR